jgi:hypothetical protein
MEYVLVLFLKFIMIPGFLAQKTFAERTKFACYGKIESGVISEEEKVNSSINQ